MNHQNLRATARGRFASRYLAGGRPLVRMRLELHEDVVAWARAEIRANPRIEVGGKFVGFVRGRFSATSEDWRAELEELQVSVVAYLDAGPGKDRSAVHHYSDTDYQFRLFQDVARDFPDLDFLGIWHSHHPNGLDKLSRGDEETATVTVSNPGHGHDFLISSLAVDERGLMAGRHFVFLRGHADFLEIDPDFVQVVRGPNPVAERVEAAARRLHAAGDRPGPARAPAPSGNRPPGGTASWTASAEGKAILAADKAWLGEFPDMRPFMRGGSLVWRGTAEAAGVVADCEYICPEGFPQVSPVVEARTPDGAHAVRFTLPDSLRRREGFHHALRTLAGLVAAGDGQEDGGEEEAAAPDVREDPAAEA
ncbi:hypothetical protein Skr01_53690 [Sphaerisporangium krabiense]|uniref:Uncharacterized protein n=1 Tax=Sphaerisporangium krabiense TaxID=763782 RepID=A0A7W9DQ45_9ACTN|nr:hypothetical protein [Sphaerisporangium krabiense]MBB5627126.1 hypothetical protein [Sphaerisporangium krabiense]GII65284.1 hypothetical protein Skr01_53690 [Sphaerisporangium krabiense]